MIKTLAEFKRSIKVGDKIEIKNHLHGRDRKTEISKLQTNCVCVMNERGGNSYIYYPKAGLISFENGEVSFYNQGFEFAPEEEQKIIDTISKDYENLETYEERKEYSERTGNNKRLFALTDKYPSEIDNKNGNWSDKIKGDRLLTIKIL